MSRIVVSWYHDKDVSSLLKAFALGEDFQKATVKYCLCLFQKISSEYRREGEGKITSKRRVKISHDVG